MEENIILAGHVEAMIAALQSIGKGSLADQMATHLQEAVKATMIEGKSSSVTLKLTVAKQSDEMITLTGYSEAKIPKPKPSGSFFVDPMKNFQIGRNRPNQQILPGVQNDR
ncbi:MAG TPA: hypothetical protein CFH81_02285 [Sulfurovum sp. UBA12169]|nr:MAG TPA: hypothetical protein CFH81_02285 [Sulfurovum sp. UBA12169]